MHTERARSWRVQVRRKGKYVNETFLRRKDAGEWGIDIERRIDRQDPTTTRKSRDVQLFGDLVALHRQDLEKVGKDIGRSKTASLTFLDKRLGLLRLPELDREHLIKFGKERAAEGAGPVTVGIDLGYIKTILSHPAAETGAGAMRVTYRTSEADLKQCADKNLERKFRQRGNSLYLAVIIGRNFRVVFAIVVFFWCHSNSNRRNGLRTSPT